MLLMPWTSYFLWSPKDPPERDGYHLKMTKTSSIKSSHRAFQRREMSSVNPSQIMAAAPPLQQQLPVPRHDSWGVAPQDFPCIEQARKQKAHNLAGRIEHRT